jgi:hypothetical protein
LDLSRLAMATTEFCDFFGAQVDLAAPMRR